MKILVIVPHPDDEVLGCGGAIAKFAGNGDEVFLCMATKAYVPDWTEEYIAERPKEIEKSNKILGVKKTYFLNFPTAKLDTIPQKEINASIDRVVKDVGPDIVFVPHKGDLHSDHKLLFYSSLVVTAPMRNKGIKKVFSYEVLSETDLGDVNDVFAPNVYIDVSETMDKKLNAMKAYKSEVKDYPHPRSLEMIKILAQKRGAEANLKFAEAFKLIREII